MSYITNTIYKLLFNSSIFNLLLHCSKEIERQLCWHLVTGNALNCEFSYSYAS